MDFNPKYPENHPKIVENVEPAEIDAAEAANDCSLADFVAVGKRYPIKDEAGNTTGSAMQKVFYAWDHYEVKTREDLAALLTDHSVSLPENPTADERKAAKMAVPFLILGGIKGGGATATLPDVIKRDDDANKDYRRTLVTAMPSAFIPMDFDDITPAFYDAVMRELIFWDCVAFNSPSHTPESPRLKIIFVASRPVLPAEKVAVCLRLEKELMESIGAVRSVTPGYWTFEGEDVRADGSQYRVAQVVYCPPNNREVIVQDGLHVAVDTLPELTEDELKIAAVLTERSPRELGDADTVYELKDALSPIAELALEQGGRMLSPRKIALKHCAWEHLHSNGVTGDSQAVMFLGGDLETFDCKGEHCQQHRAELIAAGKSAHWRYAVDLGATVEQANAAYGGEYLASVASADEFEYLQPLDPAESCNGPAVVIGGVAAFLKAKAGQDIQPFKQWDGMTGHYGADKLRQEISDFYGCDENNQPRKPLRFIPPWVTPLFTKGALSGFKALNHADNFRWMQYRDGSVLARNAMTYETEIFDTATNRRRTASEAATESALVGLSQRYGLPKDTIRDHFAAVAEGAEYHPLARLLHGRRWDGVQRVQRVIDCLPVAADAVRLRDAVLLAFFAGAMAAIDDGRVSLKFAPVLYSEENDYYKTSFWQRLFSVMPGSFKEGEKFSPGDKTSLRSNLYSWGVEWGELESTTKHESGPLKTHIGRDEDEWRQENARVMSRKPRQTVYMGTVNKRAFLRDEGSLASRFPIIELAAPVEIEAVNKLLGWERKGGQPFNADPESLLQFWLEVRHMRAQGLSHVLEGEALELMKASQVCYVEKPQFYENIVDKILESNESPFLAEWFSPTEAAELIRASAGQNAMVGKALALLVKEGALEGKRTKKGMRYRVAPEVQG